MNMTSKAWLLPTFKNDNEQSCIGFLDSKSTQQRQAEKRVISPNDC